MKFPRFPFSRSGLEKRMILLVFRPFEPLPMLARPNGMRPLWPPRFKRMERAMLTKSKFTGAALAALALAACLVATSGNAQARPRFGVGLGIGIATGAVIGAAVASGAYASPVYSCRYVERYDRWGNIRLIRVCDGY